MRRIDNLLNRITMYRLVLYYLISLLGAALLLSMTGKLAYDPFALLLSVAFLLGACTLTNRIFAWTFGVPANVESVYISALILALIITPIRSLNDLWFLGWASIWAMASKYIIAVKGKHLFNPVAFAVALTYFTINQSASWWVGSGPMLPFVLFGGLLVLRRIERFDLAISFLVTTLGITWMASLFGNQGFIASMQNIIVYSPLIFFASIILTEPLTTPPTHKSRIFYGLLVGSLFSPQFHIGSFYVTPEMAILIGNLFSYAVSPKGKLALTLKEKTRLAPDVYEFVFSAPHKFKFLPGQYMEWTLGHKESDARGVRRYFTLASAPTERTLRLGVKFYPNASTFKRSMLALDKTTEILASQVAGDFVLPADPRQRCVFLAGGIGITPFRSMIKYLLDIRQPRPIVLFYSAKRADELVYKDVFDRAQQELGIKVVYSVTDPHNLPVSWTGRVGRISPELIRTVVPDYRLSLFYISGPRGMVDSFKDTLRRLKTDKSHIKTDYFAGLA